jgi:hypothetical protein
MQHLHSIKRPHGLVVDSCDSQQNHRIASKDSGIQQCTMLFPHIMQHLRSIIRGKQALYGTPYKHLPQRGLHQLGLDLH